MLTNRERAWLRLHLVPGLGRRGLVQLQERFETPEEAIRAGTHRWPERTGSVRSELIDLPKEENREFQSAIRALETNRARIISYWDDAYPEILRSIHDPPALLYVRGTLSHNRALAIVGSRRCSEAGQVTTRRFAADIARHNITIISGLARGIDAAAHEGALEADGETIAVLGCGIDRIYPAENRRLFHRIENQGAIISEYPPGTAPLPGHFPGRNRIISGLSHGVLIVEAAQGSGSLLTAEFALEQGRDVFAIPGAISAQNSLGVNSLLKEGAHLTTEPRDVLNILHPGGRARPSETDLARLESLTEQEKSVVDQLSEGPLQIDDLVRKSRLTPMELSAILLQLELRGTVSQLPGMRYIRSF